MMKERKTKETALMKNADIGCAPEAALRGGKIIAEDTATRKCFGNWALLAKRRQPGTLWDRAIAKASKLSGSDHGAVE
jgi:hypothetical protein